MILLCFFRRHCSGKQRIEYFASALSSAHGLKNEIYSCVVGFLRLMD